MDLRPTVSVTTSQPGCLLFPGALDRDAQRSLVADIRAMLRKAPLFVPSMPRTGKPLSVRMSNGGTLGWVADRSGYRYQSHHPTTNEPWPPIPDALITLWQSVAPTAPPPEACLINWYGPDAKMGLHQDRDEQEFGAPVVSVSLGDDALFRLGGPTRGGKTEAIRLTSGDVLVLGGPARLCYHGVSRIYPGTSTLLDAPGRINLTMRRVTPSPAILGETQ
ncbi:MAG: alpha-ketoglutarate-dependent dioxygenase AlkB [Pseudomonadota bacterium]